MYIVYIVLYLYKDYSRTRCISIVRVISCIVSCGLYNDSWLGYNTINKKNKSTLTPQDSNKSFFNAAQLYFSLINMLTSVYMDEYEWLVGICCHSSVVRTLVI